MPTDPLQIRVVLEDRRFVVIEKPAGMLSVPGVGPGKHDCAIARVKAMFPHADGPLMVHRLDTDTSGLLLVALDAPTQRALSMQFEARSIEKAYVAMLDGTPIRSEGVIDLPLRLDPDNRPYQVVDFFRGRPAVTRYRVLATDRGRARILFHPVTGRTHQLRVHASHPGGLNCPIVGDVLYHPSGRDPGERLMLHATELMFDDPWTGLRLHVVSEPGF